MPRLSSVFLPFILVALVATACGDSDADAVTEDGAKLVDNDEPAETDPESTDPAEDTSADPGAKPTVEIPEGDAPTELVIDDLIEGTGAEAVAGQTVEVHYVGVLFDDGTEFDASWNRGQTFDFKLGQGQVIQGWDQGFEGMKVGGRRRLIIPSDLAYGPAGSDTIGPDATLVFVVDLVSVTAPPPSADPADEPELTYPDPVPTELVIEDLVEGEGDRSAQPDDTLIVNYVGGAMSTQEVVDSSWQRGEALRINLKEIIPGWAQGVVGMKPGGRRMLVIPPELAYGAEGLPEYIAPDETLVFIVELIEIS